MGLTMIKYYRKKGTDKATHKSFSTATDTWFMKDDEIGLLTATTYRNEAFNQFLEDNGYEEVIEEKPVIKESLITEIRLPEVGKRYKQKHAIGCDYSVIVNKIENGLIFCRTVDEINRGKDSYTYRPKFFWLDYRELSLQEEDDIIYKQLDDVQEKTTNDDKRKRAMVEELPQDNIEEKPGI